MRTISLLLAVALIAIFAPPAFSQSTWSGANGNWSDSGNWTGGVPGSTSNVVIGGSTDPFGSPLLDVSATVNNLNLGMQASLTLSLFTSLTVNGTATLVGDVNVDEGTLTLNGAATNFQTMNLTTQTFTFEGHTFTLGEGFVNGTGTLGNAGTIQGAGNISVSITNLGTIEGTGSNPLILSGSVGNGGTVQNVTVTGTISGGIVQGSISSNGGTITDAQLGSPFTITNPGSFFNLTAGSTLNIQGSVSNATVMNLGTGATINGGGTATVFNNNGGPVISGGGSTLVGLTINNASGTVEGGGTGLTLNNVAVTGGTVQGQFTTLNGTTFTNSQLGFSGGSFNLGDGSMLAVQGNVQNVGTMTLGSGVTVTGNGTGTLSNFGSLTGNGSTLLDLTLNTPGTITGTGAGITLNGVTLDGIGGVNNSVLTGLFTPLNGTLINSAQLGSGAGSFMLPDGSTLALRGLISLGSNLSLGNGTTLNGGGGGTTLANLTGGPVTLSGNGATLIGLNIDGNIGSQLVGTGAGFTLNGVAVNGGFVYGQFTTQNGTTITNAMLGTTGTPFLLTAGSTLTLEGPNTQNGQFINAGGTILIDKGSTLNNSTGISYVQTGGQTIVDGTIGIGSPAVHLEGGVLSGTGAVNSGLVNMGGAVQPGDGGAPGTLFVTTYEQQSGAIFDELIGSTGNGELFAGAGSVALDPGALLDIDLLGGFAPSDGEMFTIMEGSKVSGVFANAPTTGFEMDGWNWMIAYNANDIVLDAVSAVNGGGSGGGGTTTTPEPSSLLLLAPALFGIGILRRRAKEPLA